MRLKNFIQLFSSGYIIIIIIIIIITTIIAISVFFLVLGSSEPIKVHTGRWHLKMYQLVIKLQIKALHHICNVSEDSYSLLSLTPQ